jgi:hypothetical protein
MDRCRHRAVAAPRRGRLGRRQDRPAHAPRPHADRAQAGGAPDREALHLAKTETPKNVNARRLYVDTVKWYVGKVAPKKYGDKLDLNVTGKVTVGDAIEEGRKRVARLKGGT